MNPDLTEKLIQEVQNRPILYVLIHPDFKNKTKKRQAWKEVRQEINEEYGDFPIDVLKAKWKNLKDTYRKYKQSKRSTSTQAVKKLQNWAWADHMSFMELSIALNEDESSITCPNIVSGDNPTIDGDSTSDGEDKDTRQINKSTQESGLQETQTAQRNYRRRRPNNPDPTDRKKNLQNRIRYRNIQKEKVDIKCDGVDLLFLGYADSFKKLSKRKQVKVKFDIAKVLMDAESSDLDTATPESSTAPGFSYIMQAPFTTGNYTMIGDGTVTCYRKLYS